MTATVQTLIQLATQCMHNAYAPYSKFLVAAAILGEDGQVYTGVNVENASYGLTLCAESSAISAMITAGCSKIKSIAIMCDRNSLCPPCGACRQRIFEFSTPDTQIHLCSTSTLLETHSPQDLLPHAFKFSFQP